jgi:hypothetical protein
VTRTAAITETPPARALVTFAVLLASAGCGGHQAQFDRAADRYLHAQHAFPGLTGVSCDERGHPITIRGVTYHGYMCALHGGGFDGANKALWWDGTRVYGDCAALPRRARNALCFD